MARSNHIEGVLRHLGMFPEFMVVPITQIDQRASFENQARAEPLDLQYAEDIATGIRDGFELPPLIGWPKGDYPHGSYVIVLMDGVHRLKAHLLAKSKTVEVYLVPLTDMNLIDGYTRTLNGPIGSALGFSREAKLRGAAYNVHNLGWTHAHAARSAGLSENAVSSHIFLEKTKGRVKAHGLGESIKDMTPKNIRRLGNIKSSVVFVEAVTMAGKFHLVTDQVETLVKLLNEETTEAGALAALMAYCQRPDVMERVATGNGPNGKFVVTPQPKRRALYAAMLALERMANKDMNLDEMQCGGKDHHARITAIWSTVRPWMDRVVR